MTATSAIWKQPSRPAKLQSIRRRRQSKSALIGLVDKEKIRRNCLDRVRRESTTEADRQAAQAWLDAHPEPSFAATLPDFGKGEAASPYAKPAFKCGLFVDVSA
jgi:hypothetical protein